jgi:Flp pilus assembly protein TadG
MIRMRPRFRRRELRRAKRGQVMVLFALAAVVVVGMVAVAIDGGYGLVQMRRAQNAVAGTNAVKSVCQGSASPPTNASVYAAIQDVIDQNSAAVNAGWTGTYLDRTGATIPNSSNGNQPYTVTNTNAYPPAIACGVSVQVTPSWQPFIAQIVGVNNLTSTATAKSVLNPAIGQSVAIVALNQIMPHEVLGGGTGNFNVYGTIFANSTVPYGPWNQTHNGNVYNDVVDAKDTSNLVLHGIMETVGNQWPLDWCFGNSGAPPPPYNNTPPVGKHSPDPFNTAICSNVPNLTPLKYDQIVNGQSQISDPLLPVGGSGGVIDPFVDNTQGLCPGENSGPTLRSVPAPVNGTTTLLPGEYTSPVIITSGNVQFADCSGAFDPVATNTAIYPGVFRFDKGLALMTPAGTTVQGNNVMIATGSPVPLPANVPGSWSGSTFVASGTGNGAPCYPAGVNTTGGKPETDAGSPVCGGTTSSAPAPFGSLFTSTAWSGVISYNQSTYAKDTSQYGTGYNFSLMLGGAGTITLTPPNTGMYRDIGLFQQRATAGNFGLDAYPGDSATITVNGVVYNASLPCNGIPKVNGVCASLNNLPQPNPFAYWDVGVVFNNGGMLQTGVGTGTNYPKTSTGTVTINGPSVVEDFNTDGATTIVIDGTKNTYNLPGVVGSGNPPIVG